MNRPLRLTSAAVRDIQRATDWYRRRNPATATRFVAAVRLAYRLLDSGLIPAQPLPPPLDTYGVGRCRVRGFRYQLIVQDTLFERRVIAVTHSSRRPGHWAGRL